MKGFLISIILIMAGTLTAATGWAAREVALEKVTIDVDTETLKRGARTALDLCGLCHSLKYIHYRDLLTVGFSRREVDELRSGRSLEHSLLSSTSPQNANALFGAMPPDLSLMASAREGGARYIYSLLTGYSEGSDGRIGNRVFPGTAMPDVLAYSVEPDAVARKQLAEKARDVSAFLKWAADPQEETRHTIGYYVIAYLVVLTILFYLVKRKVWRRLD